MNILNFLIGFSLLVLIITGVACLISVSPWALLGGFFFLFFLYQVTNVPDYRTRYRD